MQLSAALNVIGELKLIEHCEFLTNLLKTSDEKQIAQIIVILKKL